MSRLKRYIDQVLGTVLVGLMFILLLVVIWQVVSRYVFGAPSSFTDELARYLLIWVALLGGAYLVGQQSHLAIDLLSSRIRGEWVQYVTPIVVAVFAITVLIIGGSRLTHIILSLEQRSASLDIPLGYVYLVLPLSGLLMLAYSIFQLMTVSKKAR